MAFFGKGRFGVDGDVGTGMSFHRKIHRAQL